MPSHNCTNTHTHTHRPMYQIYQQHPPNLFYTHIWKIDRFSVYYVNIYKFKIVGDTQTTIILWASVARKLCVMENRCSAIIRYWIEKPKHICKQAYNTRFNGIESTVQAFHFGIFKPLKSNLIWSVHDFRKVSIDTPFDFGCNFIPWPDEALLFVFYGTPRLLLKITEVVKHGKGSEKKVDGKK